mgnify:CR=1 FL=1
MSRVSSYLIIAVTVLLSVSAHAEADKTQATTPVSHSNLIFPDTGTIGATFSVPAGGGATAGATYFINPKHALHFEVGFDFNKPAIGSNGDGYSIDIGYRIILKKAGHVMVFIQPGLLLEKTAQTGDFKKLLIVAPNFAGGAEYFFNENFSIAALTGVALSFKNEFKQKRIYMQSAALTGAFYF